jgi:hypothetical protein
MFRIVECHAHVLFSLSELDQFELISDEFLEEAASRLSTLQLVGRLVSSACFVCKTAPPTHMSASHFAKVCLNCLLSEPTSENSSQSVPLDDLSAHELYLEAELPGLHQDVPNDEISPTDLPAQISSFPFVNKFSFKSEPHIIVDSSVKCCIAPQISCSAPKPLFTSSIVNAIEAAEPGWTIQIRRGSCLYRVSMLEHGVYKQLRICGETKRECAKRLKLPPDTAAKSLPAKPYIYVSENCAFVSTAPLLLENLVIESGHNCPSCDPADLGAFAAIATDSLLLVKNCEISAFQGPCIVASAVSRVISQDCSYDSPSNCIYLHDDADLIATECQGNTFFASRTHAIGAVDAAKAQKLADELIAANHNLIVGSEGDQELDDSL